MTDQCSIASRVLPPGARMGTDLLVATWLLTTDHRSRWSVPWLLCRLICRWSLGYGPPRSPLLAVVSLISLPPGPRVALRVVHVVPYCWRHRRPMTDRITPFYSLSNLNYAFELFCVNFFPLTLLFESFVLSVLRVFTSILLILLLIVKN